MNAVVEPRTMLETDHLIIGPNLRLTILIERYDLLYFDRFLNETCRPIGVVRRC